MFIGKQIEDLIEDGWNVIECESDSVALQDWKRKVSDAFKTLLGPDNSYSTYGDDLLHKQERTSASARTGLSTAVNDHVPKRRL